MIFGPLRRISDWRASHLHWRLDAFPDLAASTTVRHVAVTEGTKFDPLLVPNVVVGVLLGPLAMASAPAIAALYREPRLVE